MQSFSAVQTNKISIGKSITKTQESLFVGGNTRIKGSTFIDNILSVKDKIAIGNADCRVSLDLGTNDAIRVPVGTTQERPNTNDLSSSKGYIRFNTDLDNFEGFGKNNSWNLISGNNQQQHLDIDNIVDNIVFNGNLKLENKISAMEMELTSLTPNLVLTYPGMKTKEVTPNYSNYIYTSPSGSLNINPSINNTTGNVLNLLYNKGGGSSSAYEYVSRIRMVGQNDGSIKGENSARYGEIATQIIDATDNAESSNMEFAVMSNGTLTDMLILCGRGYDNDISQSLVRIDTNIVGKKDFVFKGHNNNKIHWNKNESQLNIIGDKDNYALLVNGGDVFLDNNIKINGNIFQDIDYNDISNIQKILDPIDDITKIDSIIYNRKQDNHKKKFYGLTSEYNSDFIKKDKANCLNIDYTNLMVLLVESIKIQNKEIQKLSKEIDIIKSNYSK